jgi:hypothetical protein
MPEKLAQPVDSDAKTRRFIYWVAGAARARILRRPFASLRAAQMTQGWQGDRSLESGASKHHVVVAEPEVVAELVDHGFADLAFGLACASRHAKDRAAEDGDLVG